MDRCDGGLTSWAECEKCSCRMRIHWTRARAPLLALHRHLYFILSVFYCSLPLSFNKFYPLLTLVVCIAMPLSFWFTLSALQLQVAVSSSPFIGFCVSSFLIGSSSAEVAAAAAAAAARMALPAHPSLSFFLPSLAPLRCLIDAWPASPISLLFGPTLSAAPALAAVCLLACQPACLPSSLSFVFRGRCCRSLLPVKETRARRLQLSKRREEC